MYPKLLNYINNARQDASQIPGQRKQKIEKIANYIRRAHQGGKEINLIFICTHNSRRSHFCQIWAATAARYFGLNSIRTFSGGTEATDFNTRAIAALDRAGFHIENPGGSNPPCRVFFDEKSEPLICFSKKFDAHPNPTTDFLAMMTCSEADANCPFIPGAALRTSLPYQDPKEADGTPEESRTYDERCRQIATEIVYMISAAKSMIDK